MTENSSKSPTKKRNSHRSQSAKLPKLPKLPSEWPLTYDDWRHVTLPFHTTIQDILDLQPGNSLTFTCLDRNVLDSVDAQPGSRYAAESFFRHGYHVQFTRLNSEDLKGHTEVSWFEKVRGKYVRVVDDGEPDSYAVRAGPADTGELHIEYRPGYWTPLRNGSIDLDDEEFKYFPKPSKGRTHWSHFSKTTRVGIRGPMIETHYLKFLPQLYNIDIDRWHKVMMTRRRMLASRRT